MKKYSVSRFFRITVWIAILGIILLCVYGFRLYRFHHSTELTEDTIEYIKTGDYVKVTIDRYVLYKVKMGETNKYFYTGVLRTDYSGVMGIWDIYTIPLGDSLYIQLGISNIGLRDYLRDNATGEAETRDIYAKVCINNDPIPNRYRYAVDFDRNCLKSNFLLRQVSEKEVANENKILLFLGGIALILAVLLLFMGAGIQVVHEKPFEESSQYIRITHVSNYALETELQREELRLAWLKDEQSKTGRWLTYGFTASVTGIIIALLGYVKAAENSLLIYLIYLGLLFLLIGLHMVWKGFINSGLPLAAAISDKFQLDTYPMKIMSAERLIRTYQKRIQIEEEKKKRQEEVQKGTLPEFDWRQE
ncbi:MAG: hypothetical protein J6Z35_04065 [Lachnospiraceae bacterium]|nr:hypothetical protein [Lachnospiraceae bacterium]